MSPHPKQLQVSHKVSSVTMMVSRVLCESAFLQNNDESVLRNGKLRAEEWGRGGNRVWAWCRQPGLVEYEPDFAFLFFSGG